MNHLFPYPKMGWSWLEILEDPLTRNLLGHDATMAEKIPFVSSVRSRFRFLLQDPLNHLSFSKIGYTALEAFLQANCTGPPLDFDSVPVIIPQAYLDDAEQLKQEMLKGLSVDGIDVYPLTPRIELFWLAKCMMDNSTLAEEGFNGRRARLRVNFWHQKLLSETSDTLRSILYHDAEILDTQMSSRLVYGGAAAQEHMVEFLIERANIRIYYGDDVSAREDLVRAAKLRDFEFALTGQLGKRTKFQQNETSQLVVMAKSRDHEPEPYSSRKSSRADQGSRKSSIAEKSMRSMSLKPLTPASPSSDMGQMFSSMIGPLSPKEKATQPENIPLNDDTLFESIQFASRALQVADPTTEIVTEQSHLPIRLAFMDAADQPLLFSMDSIILLAIASSITNTQAEDGLTREETMPYAERVLKGGSSNWSVYSQALLVRSRIEGYKSRTVERGLLQLQALVDQVIAETTGTKVVSRTDGNADTSDNRATTFLPQPVTEEGASVAERLRFIHQLSPPYRWELEAELAARWTSMGGLKTALEIYERLQMHAEVSLCLAATDREAEAADLLKRLLFPNLDLDMKDGETITLHEPAPSDAPRLLCILGDIQQQPKYYNLAWTVSNQRYARAQRSLGRFYLKNRDMQAAVQAYSTTLRIARQDLGTWFSLGCVQLELEDYHGAVESFTRVVQLEDKDAQGWSNLAVALLRLPALESAPPIPEPQSAGLETITETDDNGSKRREAEIDPLQHTREALRALRKAAQLKRDDARIWDNYLTVAASIPPDDAHPERGTPWQEVVHAMSQVISLRHKKEGESCVDLKILDALVNHVTGLLDYPTGEDEDEVRSQSAETPVTETASSSTSKPLKPSTDDNNTTDPAISTNQSLSKSNGNDEEPSPHLPPKISSQPRLPFLVRALTTLIDTQIAPLATSSPHLFQILSRVALWRHRPAESLSLVEKSWRASQNLLDVGKTTSKELIEATETLINAYRTLGPMERERTGGLVEKGWRFKCRMAVRSAIGKLKGDERNSREVEELEGLVANLKAGGKD